MNYMERGQFESEGIAKLILKHAGIIRQNYIVVIAMAIAGLVAGIIVQVSATDTFIKEVLLKNGNGLHLSVISDLMQPSLVRMRNQDSPSQPSGSGLTTNNSRPVTNLTIENTRAESVVFGGIPQGFSRLKLDIVKRVANSTSMKTSVIFGLPKDSRLHKLASKNEDELIKIVKKFKISSLSRGSDEILIRFDGKSIAEAEMVVSAMLKTLRQQFTDLEKNRINTAFKAKLLVIDTQIKAQKNVLSSVYSEPDIGRMQKNDLSLIALNSEKTKITSFPIDQMDIEPFIVIPIDLSKKVSFISGKLWLVMATFAGLIFGLFLCYAMYGIAKLKES